jgi:pimeloyl-ACP methyl ester carboxylesterase
MAGAAESAHVLLPVDLSGELNGAEYKIRVPSSWNGTLLVFAHGTQLQPGTAEIAPTAWPVAAPSVEEQLLALGYALAGSGFENSPKDGVLRTLALTNFFNGQVGHPNRTIVWGASLGATVALKLVEEHPGIYDGAIAIAAPNAGRPENTDSALAFGLAYDAAFGWREDLWGPIEDVRDDLAFGVDVQPFVPWPPSNYGRWEFIRLTMRLTPQAFWGKDPQTNSFFFGLGMWKATAQRASVESEAGGPVAENVGFEYTLTADEKTYLNSLGVDADALLAEMNLHTNITARRSARNHAEQWGGLSGLLIRPVLAMHAKHDGLAAVYNESAYAAAVAAAGASDRLVQAYVNTVGHVSFSGDQYLSVVAAMNGWLETGVRPSAAELPAAQGFDLTYAPIAWPF